MASQLLIHTVPHQGESLLGYLERCATRNFCNRLEWLLEVAGCRRATEATSALLRQLAFGEASLGPIATLCAVEEADLASRTYKALATGPGSCRFGDDTVPTAVLSTLKRKTCPLCTREGLPRHRLLDISYYVACHRHGCWLSTECSTCGETQWLTSSLDRLCQTCNTPFDPPVSPASEDALALSSELARLDEGERNASPIRFATLHDLLSALNLAVQIHIPESALGRFELSPQLCRDAELQAWVISAWPWIASPERFAQSALSYWNDRRATFPDLPSRALSIAVDRFVNGIGDSGIEPVCQWQLPAYVREPRELTNARTEALLQEYLTSADATMVLGVSKHNLRQLADAQLVSARYAFEKSKYSDRVYGVRDINILLASLRQISCSEAVPTEEQLVPFDDACRLLGNAGSIGAVGLLRKLLEGDCPFWMEPDAGLEGITIMRSLLNGGHVLEEGFLTLPQVIEKLGLYPDAVYRLVRAGMLETTRRRVRGAAQHVIHVDALARFKAEFVLCGELASRHGANVTNLADRLMDAGIRAVSGPRIDRGLVYVFRRDETPDEKVKEILSRPHYSSRAGRRKQGAAPPETGGLIESTAVATRLRVNMMMLGRMVERNVLAEHPVSRRLGNRRYFEPAVIEVYERRYLANPDLTQIEEAVLFLGTTRLRLFRDYVQTGRLKTVDDGAGRIFLEREAVSKAKENADVVSSGQATLLLSLKHGELGNLRKLGKLTPIGGTSRALLYSLASIKAAKMS